MRVCRVATGNMLSLHITAKNMVLILDGNSEIDAQVKRNLFYLIDLRHSISLSMVTSRVIFFYPGRPIFRHACATCAELPSNISTITGQPSFLKFY